MGKEVPGRKDKEANVVDREPGQEGHGWAEILGPGRLQATVSLSCTP